MHFMHTYAGKCSTCIVGFYYKCKKMHKIQVFFRITFNRSSHPATCLDDFPQKNPTFWQKKKVKTTTWQEEDIMEQTCVWAVLVGGEYFHSVQSGDLGKSK